ncbi:MAG TPA: protein kinase [Terriglobia bacterium]|nr:protein kinase [Terriglobia bacterium]
MSLAPGNKLGPYEILSPLGAGGMGEVYRARDSKLNREVALKVLPGAVANDAERMARFQREAQVLASLNHPNIASIYGLEDSGGVRALVMELVEGPTLAERISMAAASDHRSGVGGQRPPLQLDEALHIARQIAEALEAAHERGIIHRDLKPANIKITDEGVVKVLDFGLAKALTSEDSSSGISNSPTISIAATQAGMILGTAAYMSPEQAKGKKVDRRADIWAFGCVLFEMLTGKKTFEGETTSDVLAAVIRAEPEWNALPVDTPPSIRKLLQRCLQKDAKQRLRDIGEARITIEETLSGAEAEPPLTPLLTEEGKREARGGEPWRAGKVWRRVLPWALVVVLSIVAVVTTVLLEQSKHRAARVQFAIPVSGEVSHLALSADGSMLAYVANDESSGENMLFVQKVGSPTQVELPGTEGAYYPFWSPDGAWVAFFASGKLKKTPVAGGPPQFLANSTFGRGGSWGSRGVIVYTPDSGGGMWRVNADGTNAAPLPAALMEAGDYSQRWPLFLPDGEHFLFLSLNFRAKNEGVKMGLFVSSLTGQHKTFLVSTQSSAGYLDGQLFYLDDKQELMAVRADAVAGKVLGEPYVVANTVDYRPSTYYASFSVANNGTIVYNPIRSSSLSALTWFDRNGKEMGRVGEPGVLANPAVSPDGKRITVDITDQKASIVNIWTEDFDRKTRSRFTFDQVETVVGAWSRDGSNVAYRAVDVASEVRLKKSTGLEQWKTLFTANGGDDYIPNSWSLDDRQILCTAQPAAGGSHLVLIDAASGKETPFLTGKAMETNGQISPDGKWVAYASNESGDWDIYVTTFPNPVGKWQISRDGGTEPRWRPDGKEIFYINLKGELTAVEVSAESTFSTGTPVTLFPIRARAQISSTDLYSYDVSKDGKRFLVNRYIKPDHVEPLTVVLNAAEGMKQ